MILLAVGAIQIGTALVCLYLGRVFGRAELGEALDAETWRANCWQKRCEQLEQLLHVRPVSAEPRRR